MDKEQFEARVACKFYVEGNCRFGDKCRNLHEPNISDKTATVASKSDVQEDSEISSKKPPMKTADDVISLLLWDDKLQTHVHKFIVGYLDRFTGIVERDFNEFNWSDDISSVDDYSGVLTIPRHRIQYFKYRNYIFWDKTKRLDLIFGSTGNKNTDIYTLIADVDASLETESVTSDDERNFYDLLLDVYSPREHHRKTSIEDEQVRLVLRIEPLIDIACAAPTRVLIEEPTHFLAVRLTNPELLERLFELLKHINIYMPTLGPSLYKPEMLQITVATFRLVTVDQINKAVVAVQDLVEYLKPSLRPPIKFQIRGLGVFHKKILHAKVNYPDNYPDFVTKLKSHFQDRSIMVTSAKNWIPHVTIAKCNKKIKIVPKSEKGLTEYMDFPFGHQYVDNLHLCVIGGDKRLDGFYSCLYENSSLL